MVRFFISQFLTLSLILFLSLIFLLVKLIKQSISSGVVCSCVFVTRIVLVENKDKLNSDFEKLKFVIFSLNKFVFSPLYNSRIAMPLLFLKTPFLA